MPIITDAELASYLETTVTASLTMKANMSDKLVTELIYASGLPATIPTRVKAITLEVAARAVRNPGGYSSETVEDYTYRLPTETRQAGIYLTPGERAELLGLDGVPQVGMYVLDLGTPAP